MSPTVDLNADVGESTGARRHGDDEGVMPHITSANIACGFHAGDPGVMRATVALALAHGVAIGAHPGLHDLEGFGRREMRVSPDEVENLVAYQVGALAGIAAAQRVALAHVKPHGALYNMAARERTLADAVVRAVRAVDPSLVLFGLSNSELVRAASAAGLAGGVRGLRRSRLPGQRRAGATVGARRRGGRRGRRAAPRDRHGSGAGRRGRGRHAGAAVGGHGVRARRHAGAAQLASRLRAHLGAAGIRVRAIAR